MPIFLRAIVPALLVALSLAAPVTARAQEQPSEDTWNNIKGDIFKDRPILDGTGLVTLDAPRRAEDAAIVPIGMRVNLANDDKRTLKSLTLVIDENPAPVAGTFTIGPHAGVTSISTRVRRIIVDDCNCIGRHDALVPRICQATGKDQQRTTSTEICA